MADRTPGIYVRLDANYDVGDEAIWMAGILGELLFIRSLAYSKRKQTDGFIPSMALLVVGARFSEPLEPIAQRLVDVGLWETSDDPCGWQITGWEKWQMTTGEIAERRSRNQQNALARHHKDGRHDHEPHPLCELCATRTRGDADPERAAWESYVDGTDFPTTTDHRPQTPSAASRSGGKPGSPPHQGCGRCDGSGWVDQGNRTVSRCPGYLRSVPAEEAS